MESSWECLRCYEGWSPSVCLPSSPFHMLDTTTTHAVLAPRENQRQSQRENHQELSSNKQDPVWGKFSEYKNKSHLNSIVKRSKLALAGVAQWIECQPENQRVAGSFSSHSTYLGCRPGPQQGVCEKPLHSFSPCVRNTLIVLSLFFSFHSPLPKNK